MLGPRLRPLLFHGVQKLSKHRRTVGGGGGYKTAIEKVRTVPDAVTPPPPAQGPRRSLWTRTKNSESLLPRGGQGGRQT